MSISVIMPTHNGDEQFVRAVRSVLSQFHADIELIIVDDASSVLIATIASRHTKNHPVRTKVIRLAQRLGVSAARNKGLEIASGKYVAFMDADDIMLPGALNIMFHQAEARNADVVIGGYMLDIRRDLEMMSVSGGPFHPENHLNIRGWQGFYSCPDYPQLLPRLFEGDLFHPVYNKLYRRDMLKDVRFDEHLFTCFEDEAFNLDAMAVAKSVIVVPDLLYRTDFSGQDILSRKYDDNRYLNLLKLCRKYERLIEMLQYDADSHLVSAFHRQILFHFFALLGNWRKAIDFADPSDLVRYAECILATPKFRESARQCNVETVFLASVIRTISDRIVPDLCRISFGHSEAPANLLIEQARLMAAMQIENDVVVRHQERRIARLKRNNPLWVLDTSVLRRTLDVY